MSDQKICPTCGTEYPLSERFCPRDGTALRSASSTGDLLGSVVADRYHILKKLGEGGMGAVYLAEHVKMGRKSALKVMHPGMNSDPDAIARFNREASNASRLSHPNICGIYDFGETPDGLIYLAMEFIEGKALADIIEGEGALPGARAGSIVHQTADALQVAHDAGIVHRDLKPDNIMVSRNRDGSDQVKVVDFGIAKASSSDAQKVTKTGLVVGTPEYMSPEQLAGDKLDGRSDIYSLGLVAFNCLTGKLPFPSESAQEAMIMRLTDRPRTLEEIRPDIAWPASLQAVMDRVLARDAEERYQSAAQFGREFAEAVSGMPKASTDGATMVIGAMPDAHSAATKAIPATRVAGSAESRAPARAPAGATAPEKKSSLVPMLVGGAAIVAAAGLGYLKFAGGSGEPAVGPDTTAVAEGPAPAGGAAVTPPPTAEAGASAPLSNPTKAPAPNAGAAGNAPNLGAPSVPAVGGTRAPSDGAVTTPMPSVPTGPSAGEYANKLASYVQELTRATPARIRIILADVESFQSQLSGSNLAESWYVLMQGYGELQDPDGTCRAARKVKELHREQSRVGLANIVLEGC